ncbi:XdhC family protein [Urechidicola sp. KH5]
MTHEFKKIIQAIKLANKANQKTVLATVVAVDGSSYRGAGVRMLVLESGNIVGAISGGCVEKEVVLQAESVLRSGTSKIMTYDGRFRLGCEGTLYVLLELVDLNMNQLNEIGDLLDNRIPFDISSKYYLEEGEKLMGSNLIFNGKTINLSESASLKLSNAINFSETLYPCFRLFIVGTEHDAASLSKASSQLGWEVTVIAAPDSQKSLSQFPGAKYLEKLGSEAFSKLVFDSQTAVVLMSHNFAKDVLYLKALKDKEPMYIGLLGPAKRRNQMLDAFIEYHVEVSDEFLDTIYGPAGLDIGAETPEEIAVSIISEIVAVSRNIKALHLQDKKGAIHDRGDRTLKSINEK